MACTVFHRLNLAPLGSNSIGTCVFYECVLSCVRRCLATAHSSLQKDLANVCTNIYNPGTGKPWPTLTDARTAKKIHDEPGGGGGREKEMEVVGMLKRWEKRGRRRKHEQQRSRLERNSTHRQGNNCLRAKYKHRPCNQRKCNRAVLN